MRLSYRAWFNVSLNLRLLNIDDASSVFFFLFLLHTDFFDLLPCPLAVLQDLWSWTEEAERVLPQHRSRGQSGGGARQHVQTAPQTQSPGDLRPAALPQERAAAVEPHSVGRGKEKETWSSGSSSDRSDTSCFLLPKFEEKSALKHLNSVTGTSFCWCTRFVSQVLERVGAYVTKCRRHDLTRTRSQLSAIKHQE